MTCDAPTWFDLYSTACPGSAMKKARVSPHWASGPDSSRDGRSSFRFPAKVSRSHEVSGLHSINFWKWKTRYHPSNDPYPFLGRRE